MIAIEDVRQLTLETLGTLTVLTGDDLGQYAQLRESLLEVIGFDKASLSFSYFDLAEDDYQKAQLDLESLPFLSDYKVVILDNVLDITTTKKHHLDESSLKQFEAYLEAPVSSTKLIVLAPGKLDSKRRLVKLLKRDGKVIEAKKPKEAELKTYFQQYAHQHGLVFEKGAFEELLHRSGFDYASLHKNMAFLIAYQTEGQISLEDIAEAIPKTLQDNIFELTKLVLNKRVAESLALVADLRLQGEDEIKLIAIMIGQFRLFMQVSILSSRGQSEYQIKESLSDYLGRSVNPYQIRYAIRDSRGLSYAFLAKSLILLIETDAAIKKGLYDKSYLFELALLKLMA
ncbi:DNA polymerase III subunit delta [Streptococcus sp. zg-JUN1979]|uniref:DNA polymerase III subunit delta n=1 Tax=Streptococcus sp. zg-JUN1979 TaxID=3391450 RepID=UPI0039A65254